MTTFSCDRKLMRLNSAGSIRLVIPTNWVTALGWSEETRVTLVLQPSSKRILLARSTFGTDIGKMRK
jgi:hypothetical protein